MLEDLQKYIANREPAISADDMNTLGEVVRLIRSIAGENFFVDASGVYQRKAVKPTKPVMILIGAATQDGSNKRWKYDWTEYGKSTAGYGGWTAVSDGRSGHDSSWGYAYNMVEDGNGASGTYGNGVASSNLTGTLDIQKVPPNQVIVLASVVYPEDDGLPELWFSYENGIDGSCA